MTVRRVVRWVGVVTLVVLIAVGLSLGLLAVVGRGPGPSGAVPDTHASQWAGPRRGAQVWDDSAFDVGEEMTSERFVDDSGGEASLGEYAPAGGLWVEGATDSEEWWPDESLYLDGGLSEVADLPSDQFDLVSGPGSDVAPAPAAAPGSRSECVAYDWHGAMRDAGGVQIAPRGHFNQPFVPNGRLILSVTFWVRNAPPNATVDVQIYDDAETATGSKLVRHGIEVAVGPNMVQLGTSGGAEWDVLQVFNTSSASIELGARDGGSNPLDWAWRHDQVPATSPVALDSILRCS